MAHTAPEGPALACTNSAPTPTAASSSPVELTTNAVTRQLSNLHVPTWLGLLSLNITARTLLFHPLKLSISRKRITREEKPPTVHSLILAAYRGGSTSFTPGGAKYEFGRGGIRGCYRGLGIALTANILGEGSYLVTLEVLREKLGHKTVADADKERQFNANSWSSAIGAMAGDFVSLVLITPLSVVCNRQMTASYGLAVSNRYRSAAQTLKEVWHLYGSEAERRMGTSIGPSSRRGALPRTFVSGLRGMYQGASVGLMRMPSSGCWWALYTKAKEGMYTVASPTLTRLESQQRQRAANEAFTGALSSPARRSVWSRNWWLSPTDNPILNASAAAIASVVTTFLFNPVSVVQTRLQTLPPEFAMEIPGPPTTRAATATRPWPFKRVHCIISDLLSKEGVRGLFKGATANGAVAVMDGVVFAMLFELSKLGSDREFLQQMCNSVSEEL